MCFILNRNKRTGIMDEKLQLIQYFKKKISSFFKFKVSYIARVAVKLLSMCELYFVTNHFLLGGGGIIF
jgi:hypothetical protein